MWGMGRKPILVWVNITGKAHHNIGTVRVWEKVKHFTRTDRIVNIWAIYVQ